MRYTGSLDVRCVRTCVCNPAAVTAAEELHARKIRTCVCNPAALKAAEELHARSKGYSTSVTGVVAGDRDVGAFAVRELVGL